MTRDPRTPPPSRNQPGGLPFRRAPEFHRPSKGATALSPAASCTDCGWSFDEGDFEEVADALERHARKEQHHVEFERRAAASA